MLFVIETVPSGLTSNHAAMFGVAMTVIMMRFVGRNFSGRVVILAELFLIRPRNFTNPALVIENDGGAYSLPIRYPVVLKIEVSE